MFSLVYKHLKIRTVMTSAKRRVPMLHHNVSTVIQNGRAKPPDIDFQLCRELKGEGEVRGTHLVVILKLSTRCNSLDL